MSLLLRSVVNILLLIAGVILGLIMANSINQIASVPNPVYIPHNFYITNPDYHFDVHILTQGIPVERKIVVDKVHPILIIEDVPVNLDDWEDTEELERFLVTDDTDRQIVLTANPDGVVEFNGRCEDIALQLRDRAMAQGKYLSVQILHREEYYKWFGKWIPHNAYHAVCMARIGSEFYIIDPSTDESWLAYKDN